MIEQISYKGATIPVETGDIILYRNEFSVKEPVTFISAGVRFFTGFPYNHAALVSEKDGQLVIVEALGKGIVSRPAKDHLERSYSYIMILKAKDGLPENFVEKANSKVGIDYDYRNLLIYQPVYRVTLALSKLEYSPVARPVWLGEHDIANEERKMVCSEYIAWVYGLENWYMISSRELYEAAEFYVSYQDKVFIKSIPSRY